MKQVLVVSGKAKHVFKYMELVSKYKGNQTIRELAEEQKRTSDKK